MMKCSTVYSKEKHRAIQQALAEMNDDPDMSPNFTVCLTLLSDMTHSWMASICISINMEGKIMTFISNEASLNNQLILKQEAVESFASLV